MDDLIIWWKICPDDIQLFFGNHHSWKGALGLPQVCCLSGEKIPTYMIRIIWTIYLQHYIIYYIGRFETLVANKSWWNKCIHWWKSYVKGGSGFTSKLSVFLVIGMHNMYNLNKVCSNKLLPLMSDDFLIWQQIYLEKVHFYGSVQERRNSSALAMGLRLSRTKPSICS